MQGIRQQTECMNLCKRHVFNFFYSNYNGYKKSCFKHFVCMYACLCFSSNNNLFFFFRNMAKIVTCKAPVNIAVIKYCEFIVYAFS